MNNLNSTHLSVYRPILDPVPQQLFKFVVRRTHKLSSTSTSQIPYKCVVVVVFDVVPAIQIPNNNAPFTSHFLTSCFDRFFCCFLKRLFLLHQTMCITHTPTSLPRTPLSLVTVPRVFLRNRFFRLVTSPRAVSLSGSTPSSERALYREYPKTGTQLTRPSAVKERNKIFQPFIIAL